MMRPATRAGLMGNASFVDCDVQQICKEVSGGFGSARDANARVEPGSAQGWKKQEHYSRARQCRGQEFETGQFQGWIKGTI
jgi:hypothetical protein